MVKCKVVGDWCDVRIGGATSEILREITAITAEVLVNISDKDERLFNNCREYVIKALQGINYEKAQSAERIDIK